VKICVNPWPVFDLATATLVPSFCRSPLAHLTEFRLASQMKAELQAWRWRSPIIEPILE
jgi:hypothetical protein